jgi:hypothetical protein
VIECRTGVSAVGHEQHVNRVGQQTSVDHEYAEGNPGEQRELPLGHILLVFDLYLFDERLGLKPGYTGLNANIHDDVVGDIWSIHADIMQAYWLTLQWLFTRG